MSKQRLSLRSGSQKCHSDREKAQQVRSNEKVMLAVFLIVRALLIMNVYLVARRWTRNVVWRWWIGWEWQWREKGLICGGGKVIAPPWQRSGAFLSCDSWFSHETWDDARPQPPYSPDPAPTDFFLFPKLKSVLKGQRFESVEEIKVNSLAELRSIPKETFQECFQKWKKCWERCGKS